MLSFLVIHASAVAAATVAPRAGTATVAAAKPCMVRGNGRQIDPGTDRRPMR